MIFDFSSFTREYVLNIWNIPFLKNKVQRNRSDPGLEEQKWVDGSIFLCCTISCFFGEPITPQISFILLCSSYNTMLCSDKGKTVFSFFYVNKWKADVFGLAEVSLKWNGEMSEAFLRTILETWQTFVLEVSAILLH